MAVIMLLPPVATTRTNLPNVLVPQMKAQCDKPACARRGRDCVQRLEAQIRKRVVAKPFNLRVPVHEHLQVATGNAARLVTPLTYACAGGVAVGCGPPT